MWFDCSGGSADEEHRSHTVLVRHGLAGPRRSELDVVMMASAWMSDRMHSGNHFAASSLGREYPRQYAAAPGSGPLGQLPMQEDAERQAEDGLVEDLVALAGGSLAMGSRSRWIRIGGEDC